MSATTNVLPAGVISVAYLVAHYAANHARLLRGARKQPQAIAALPAPASDPVPENDAAPAGEDSRHHRLALLQPPAEPVGSGGVYDGRCYDDPPDFLEAWLVERCEALGLSVADMRSARRTDDLVGWRKYLIFEMHRRFPHASHSEIGRVFARDRSTVTATLAKMDRLEMAGMMKPADQRPAQVSENGRRLGRKAYPGETMLDYVRRRAREFGFDPREVRSPRRTRDLVKVKHLIVLEIRRNYPLASYPQIARVMGFRDHTSVLHAARKMEAIEARGFPGFEWLLERGAACVS